MHTTLLPPPRRAFCPRNSLQIAISGIPAENGKCRVETQLKIGFHLRNTYGETVMNWKQLRLPRMMIAKEKHRIEKFNGRDKHLQDSEILTLDARLVCDHDMTKVLECCENCIGRERKRAHRRKETHQKLPGPLASIPVFGAINPKIAGTLIDTESDPPTPTDPVKYQEWERSRIMVFSSTEYVDISTGECVLPTRITCYCRHHNEKVGFRIQFTARDSAGTIQASVLTNPVMMMDDHKSGKRTAPSDTKTATAGQTNRRSVSSSSRKQKQQQQQQPEQQLPRLTGQMPVERDGFDDDDEEEDQNDVDLEVGRFIPLKVEDDDDEYVDDIGDDDDEMRSSSMGVLSPLEFTSRMSTKRRVDDDDDQTMEDIQNHQFFRRKTSHDISQHFASASSSAFSSPSPFMPGSPFAKEEEQHYNVFAPSFKQAIPHYSERNGSVRSFHSIHDLSEQEGFHADSASIMMESFTTLDESAMSSQNEFQSSTSSVYSLGGGGPSPASTFTRPSFSIPTTIHPGSILYSPVSPFNPTFASPLPMNWQAANMNRLPSPSGLNPSFLDTNLMQEYQNFQHQNSVATAQQLLQQQ
ncbi:hypothetical protein BGZ65_007971, partial [Modicella reniformis]